MISAPSKAAEIILPTPISQYQTQLLVEINGKISHYEDYKTLLEREIGVWKSLLFDQKSLADEAERFSLVPEREIS